MRSFGDGEVDPDSAAIDLLVVQGVFRGLRVLLVLEVDEGETARSARLKETKVTENFRHGESILIKARTLWMLSTK